MSGARTTRSLLRLALARVALPLDAGEIPAEFGTARWITAPSPAAAEAAEGAWRFMRSFVTTGAVARAELTVCGLGAFVASLDGREVNGDFLAPGYADYGKELPYETYQLGALAAGTNELSVLVANGYGPNFTDYAPAWRAPKRLIARLRLLSGRGETLGEVVTDASWRVVTKTALASSDLYDGETWDFAAEEGKPLPVREVAPHGGALVPRATARVVRRERHPPLAVWRAGDGSFLVDFGQNLAGFAELAVRPEQRGEISLSYAEELADGRDDLDRRTNGRAAATDAFRSPAAAPSGTLAPRFAYHGFRYVKVRGYEGELTKADISAQAIYADVKVRRMPKVDDPHEAHLLAMAVNSMKMNLMSLPTDCAVRDERAPCLMDTHTYWRTACEIFDLRDYTRAWCRYVNASTIDVQAEPERAPGDLSGRLSKSSRRGTPDWSGVIVNTPYVAWKVYGDSSFVRASYPAVKRYFAFILKEVAATGGVVRRGYGDWCAPNPQGAYHTSSANVALVNSALLYRLLGYGAEMAEEMGERAQAAAWTAARERLRGDYRRAFRRDDGSYDDGSLATYALTLGCGLVRGEEAEALYARMKEKIAEGGFRTRVGIFGARELFRLLDERGDRALVRRMLAVEEAPSFGFWRRHGATTMWEQWVRHGPMASHSHVMFAGAAEYLVRDRTASLQAEIDAAWRRGGGEVVLGRGEHFLRGVRLRSNVTLRLKDGCRVRASRNCDDYEVLRGDALEPVPDAALTDALYEPPETRRGFDWINRPGARWNNALFRLYAATNAAIVGEGDAEIDGCNSYDPKGEGGMRGVHGVSAFDCRGLRFSGFTFRRTGNWAFRLQDCSDLDFSRLTVLAGHDGVHVRACDRVRIEDCVLRTGDDAIAGYANRDVVVRRCELNTACSAFRFGGTRVLIEDCRAWGPGTYPIRNSLPKDDLVDGTGDGKGTGRRNMLSFFTYFCDRMCPVRERPGAIVVRNCRVENCDRFLHYNFSGNETWQLGSPLGDIRFENVTATGVRLSLCAYGAAEDPTSLTFADCAFAFVGETDEFLRAAHLRRLELRNVKADGVRKGGALVRLWGERAPEVVRENAEGVGEGVVRETVPFSTRPI